MDCPLETNNEPESDVSSVRRGRRNLARGWHRVLGVLLALPLLWVVITGAPLGHTVDWGLDQRMIRHPWLLKAYQMTPEGEPVALHVGGHLVAEWDGRLFLDRAVIGSGRLVAALADSEGVAVVTSEAVHRYSLNGELLETLGSESLPPLPLTGAAWRDGQPHLRSPQGWHRMIHDWLEHEVVTVEGLEVDSPKPLTDAVQVQALQQAWSGEGLPLSRVLLDLHAGRFLGPAAPYFYDGVALCTVILCLSGLRLFLRRSGRARG